MVPVHSARISKGNTIIDAMPEHRYELAIDSIFPLLLAIVVGLTMTFVIFTPWALPAGMFFSAIVLFAWFWRGNEPQPIAEAGIVQPPPGADIPAVPSPSTA